MQFRSILNIKDDAFEAEMLQQYGLTLLFGETQFELMVTDENKSKQLIYELYALTEYESAFDYTQLIRAIFEQHAFLKAGFWSRISVATNQPRVTFIPESLVEEAHLSDYLRTACGTEISQSSHKYTHHSIKMSGVFGVNHHLFQYLQSTYISVSIQWLHLKGALCETFYQTMQARNPQMLLCWDEAKLHIIALKNQQVQLLNTYTVKEPADHLYYALLVVQELQFNTIQSEVYLTGSYTQSSAEYQLLKQHFNSMHWWEPLKSLKRNYAFDEVPAQRYGPLISCYAVR